MSDEVAGTDLEYAIQAYLAGEGSEAVAQRFHTGAARLVRILRERDLFRDRAARDALATGKRAATRMARMRVDVDALVRRYESGESEKALADSLGISRAAVETRLRHAGVERRGSVQANRLLATARTPEERRRNAEAAHAAVRGVPVSLDRKLKVARTNEARRNGISSNEQLLALWLTERELVAIPQKAIGPYNTDLAVESVAVEIFGGGFHLAGRHAKRLPDRMRYILNGGWNLLIIWVDRRRYPLTHGAADYLIAFLEQSRRDPTLRGQYRVIWGTGEEVPPTHQEFYKVALVPPLRASDSTRA